MLNKPFRFPNNSDLENFFTFEKIFLVEQPKFGLTIKV